MRTGPALLLALGLALAACGTGGGGGAPPPATVEAPDFHLPDVNPASATYGAAVSPRDYRGRASAWYFGHAT